AEAESARLKAAWERGRDCRVRLSRDPEALTVYADGKGVPLLLPPERVRQAMSAAARSAEPR
ncbi:MAG: hypothetical protein AB1505_29270, partial [Candidatus Latescibacterota bacterium]